MKTKKITSTKEENTVKLRSYSTMFALIGIMAMILFAAFSYINNTKPIQISPMVAKLPALQGESAITHLKENGIYNSLTEAVTAARYQVDSADTGATANNEANDLQMNFTDSGLQLKSTAKDKNWISNWQLSSFGYGTNQNAVAKGDLQSKGNRVELKRDEQNLTEWYENSPNGVEHGFTLAVRPKVELNGEALRLVIKLDGDLTAQADDNEQALTLKSNDDTKALRYEKLKVWDADGKDLTARMRTKGKGDEVWLEVEDTAAVYPITIDPTFVEIQKLTANDGAAFRSFGRSVAISGDTAIISGYIFVRNGVTWTQQQRLTASDGVELGDSVAISGDTVIIGASRDTINNHIAQGSAYIFVRNGTVWTQQQKLTASDGGMNCLTFDGSIFCDFFGSGVAILGDTVIIGAPGYRIFNKGTQGAAYVFVRNGTNWTEQQKLRASDGAPTDHFGNSVAISGNTAIIGATGDFFGVMPLGAAYIFVRNGANWTEQQKLTTSNGTGGDNFGESVAISGNTAIIGARFGVAAYIFVRNDTTWTEQQKLTESDGGTFDNFGDCVAISGETVVIGALFDDIGANINQGSAFIFIRSGTIWTQQPKLNVSDGAAGDEFGFSVAISGNTAIIGAAFDDIGSNENQGSAYVFQLNATPTPTPTPTVTPTPTPNNVCTPSTTVTEGDLFPGGIVSFGVSSGAGSVTVDHVNAGTGLQSLTVVNSINAVVNIPAFTPGTQMPVVVTFTPINPGLAVDFTLRAASTFHAANIRARCAEVCTPSTTVTEGDLFPGGIVSFGVSSGPGTVTVDHVNAGTGTQSLTVVGVPVNAVVNIPAFTPGTTAPVVVTFIPINPNLAVDFTLRAASTFHAANIRVRCGTQPNKSKK